MPMRLIQKSCAVFAVLSLLMPVTLNASEPSRKADSTKPLTLQDCYHLALRQSESLAITAEEIDKTKAQFFLAASEALGDVNFVISNTRQEVQKDNSGSAIGSTFTASSRRERKFTFNQPLFQGFKALAAIQGAGSLNQLRVEELVRAKQLLFLDVSGAFYGLLKARKDEMIIREILQLFEERMSDLKAREQIGRSRTSEVVTAEARMNLVEAELARAEGVTHIANHMLEFLTGISQDPFLLDDDTVLPHEEVEREKSHELILKRPDVQAEYQRVRNAWQNVILKQSGAWPLVTLEGNTYEKREGFQSGIDWDMLFKIDIPLFQGGKLVGNVREAVSSWKQAKLAYLQKQREVELEFKDAFQNWVSARREWQAIEKAVASSTKNYDLQKQEYENNLVSNLDVLEALELLNQNRQEGNRIYYQMNQNYWLLQVATGTCCESI